MKRGAADHRAIEALALGQGGYFDRRDALERGFSDELLRQHTNAGRFERISPGVYRLTVAPVDPHDELYLAWVWTNYRGVISHDSALALLGLTDLLPNRIHLTVPRGFRRETGPSYALHYRDLDRATCSAPRHPLARWTSCARRPGRSQKPDRMTIGCPPRSWYVPEPGSAMSTSR